MKNKVIMQLPIARPPWPQAGKDLESLCRKAIFDFSMLEGISSLAIALSGGKDSLTLLFLLKAMQGRGLPSLKLLAIHVEGDYSCGAGISREIVEKICEELEVPLIVKNASQKKETLECYRCSRERRSLIFSAAKERESTTIAFAHHREDNIQTLLLNLFHKGEFAAILPKVTLVHYGVTIIRPLIYASEASIKNFAHHYGFHRISCQCPRGQNSKKKNVEELLKRIEEDFPHIRANLLHGALLYGSNKASKP